MAPGFSGHGPVAASYPPPRAPTGYDQNYGAHGALVTGYGYTPRAQVYDKPLYQPNIYVSVKFTSHISLIDKTHYNCSNVSVD